MHLCMSVAVKAVSLCFPSNMHKLILDFTNVFLISQAQTRILLVPFLTQ